MTETIPEDIEDTDEDESKTFFNTIAQNEELARINASDGDRLTIRAGTHIQALYVDGEAPEFSEITPADGERFKSAALSIGFEIRDDGAGLRHDGENVVSNDGDAVLHDAATTTNTSATAPTTLVSATATASLTASRSPTGAAVRRTLTLPSTRLTRL